MDPMEWRIGEKRFLDSGTGRVRCEGAEWYVPSGGKEHEQWVGDTQGTQSSDHAPAPVLSASYGVTDNSGLCGGPTGKDICHQT